MIILRGLLVFIFLILGIVGIILPILPGWLFFLLAALIAFPRSGFAEGILRRIEQKSPRIAAALRRGGLGNPRPQ